VKALATAVSREGATSETVATHPYLFRYAAFAATEGYEKLLNKQEEQYTATKPRATTTAAAMTKRRTTYAIEQQ
jgi:hypothetical protein